MSVMKELPVFTGTLATAMCALAIGHGLGVVSTGFFIHMLKGVCVGIGLLLPVVMLKRAMAENGEG